MIFEETPFKGLYVIFTPIYKDDRGFLFESYVKSEYEKNIVDIDDFPHELVSVSNRNVFRGFHFQVKPYEQPKLIQVLNGSIVDIVIDVRKNSPTYKKYFSILLTGYVSLPTSTPHDVLQLPDPHVTAIKFYKKMLYIPRGFAHGFISLENDTILHYKCGCPRVPSAERTLFIEDPEINLELDHKNYIISDKDKNGSTLKKLEKDLGYY